jgi:hypothetical protein
MLIPQICRASICRYIIIVLLGTHARVPEDGGIVTDRVNSYGVWTSFLNTLRNEYVKLAVVVRKLLFYDHIEATLISPITVGGKLLWKQSAWLH